MKLRVSHLTRYCYTDRVTLEPHTLRLMPRAAGGQRVSGFRLSVSPAPAILTETLDSSGNSVHGVAFDTPSDVLEIATSFEVETLRSNPFDFLLSDAALATVPFEYPEPERDLLASYRHDPGQGLVRDIALQVAREADWRTIPFLSALNRRLFESTEHVFRETGEPQAPEQTLASGRGACRDTAVAFVACCRSAGLAARFVSGYELEASRRGKHHLHAWAEVYLPGGGWRGYDPSRGLAVAEQHIALAAAAEPALAAPVTGSYLSWGASSTMTVEIEISPIESD